MLQYVAKLFHMKYLGRQYDLLMRPLSEPFDREITFAEPGQMHQVVKDELAAMAVLVWLIGCAVVIVVLWRRRLRRRAAGGAARRP